MSPLSQHRQPGSPWGIKRNQPQRGGYNNRGRGRAGYRNQGNRGGANVNRGRGIICITWILHVL